MDCRKRTYLEAAAAGRRNRAGRWTGSRTRQRTAQFGSRLPLVGKNEKKMRKKKKKEGVSCRQQTSSTGDRWLGSTWALASADEDPADEGRAEEVSRFSYWVAPIIFAKYGFFFQRCQVMPLLSSKGIFARKSKLRR